MTICISVPIDNYTFCPYDDIRYQRLLIITTYSLPLLRILNLIVLPYTLYRYMYMPYGVLITDGIIIYCCLCCIRVVY